MLGFNACFQVDEASEGLSSLLNLLPDIVKLVLQMSDSHDDHVTVSGTGYFFFGFGIQEGRGGGELWKF